MKQKAYVAMSVLFLLLALSMYGMVKTTQQAGVVYAAKQQSVYQLDVANTRGMIYDCNMVPLVNEEVVTVAAVAPTIESIAYLNGEMGGQYRERFRNALEDGKPFLLWDVPEALAHNEILTFSVPQRYRRDQLAAHLIGYIDSNGDGASGIEMAMNDYLVQHRREIKVRYEVDAAGHVIPGAQPDIQDNQVSGSGGVVTTLDGNIQATAEMAAKKLGKGCVVVTEVPNCEIRAMASVPVYDMQNTGDLTDADSALLNRALCAYVPGSVFKLAVAAEMLEEQRNPNDYTCNGSIHVDNETFSCYNSNAHGTVSLEEALVCSCNGYFVNGSIGLEKRNLLAMMQNLGFGQATEFGRGFYSEPGNLSSLDELQNKHALANFSFGQGNVTVTPLQVTAMVNVIASGGNYAEPKLIAGTVDANMQFTAQTAFARQEQVPVMKATTAKTLRTAMEKTVTQGTAQGAAPNFCVAGIKTGTAQTGQYDREAEYNHFWYSGYISDETGPRYCITVLKEYDSADEGVTAAVFQQVADDIAAMIF